MRIGIDFGSTYSGFARYDYVKNRVEPITFIEGDPISIPSVVYINSKGKRFFGPGAKRQIGKRVGRSFEHFKMLLNERDDSIIRSRGYDDEYTPRVITKMFLEQYLKSALNVFGEERIEELYICVPEIWKNGISTLDGASILRDILVNEIDIPMDHVQVVTEPEAASAFFAYNYELETNSIFNGYILLIDYGGGTLDITVTEVKSTGNGNMEICNLESCGAGENHIDLNGNKILGNAGVAYIQNLVLNAIQDSDEYDGEEIDLSCADFVAAVVDVESQLKSHERVMEIEDFFMSYGTYSDYKEILESDPCEFTTFIYGDYEISLSYQCLLRVYEETIEPVLNEYAKNINNKLEYMIHSDPRSPSSGNPGNFKLAIVGGFGSCFFVKSQLYELYNIDADFKNDLRLKSISTDKREQAICLGAALLAAGKVRLHKIAPYSIGVLSYDGSGTPKISFGIKYHQDIIPGRPYFILYDESHDDVPDNRVVYGNLSGIKQFIIEFSNHLNRGRPMNLNQIMLDKLKDIPQEGWLNCGFSMDDSGVISFHILPEGVDDIAKGKTILLDDYKAMFDVTMAEEIQV